MQTNIVKIITIIFWCVLGYSFVFPFGESIQPTLVIVGAAIAGTHLLEFIIQRNKLNAINAGGVNGFIQTMIFGLGYWLPLLKKKD